MKALISSPVNETQRVFNELCEKGGGPGGGPARTKVLELLRTSGQALNDVAYEQTAEHLSAYPDANPWFVCFSVGLAWGHLAKFDVDFTGVVVDLLSSWDDTGLEMLRKFRTERGAQPIEDSLRGAYTLFGLVPLPATLPNSLDGLWKTQERWLRPLVTGANRPRYIGPWNATAMFMVALFAQPGLAASQTTTPPLLPPGGPISAGLNLLHKTRILRNAPTLTEKDQETVDLTAIHDVNALMAELRQGRNDWSMIDVHTGLYMLGTRDPRSDTWI